MERRKDGEQSGEPRYLEKLFTPDTISERKWKEVFRSMSFYYCPRALVAEIIWRYVQRTMLN